MSTTTTEKTSATVARKVPFYINRNYALLWGGQAVSSLGNLIFATTLTLWIVTGIIAGQSWAPLAISGAALCLSVPTFLFGPFAGVFADRWNKQRTMMWMDILRAILVALLLLIVFPLPFFPGGHLPALAQLAMIYLTMFCLTTCSVFFSPARFGTIQEIVEEKHLEQASGLGLITQNISRVIGPALAAPALFIFGVQWALLINAASFLVSALAIRWMHIPNHQQTEQAKESSPGFWRELGEGLQFFAKSRLLLVALIAMAILTISDAAEGTLSVFFLLDSLRVPAALYGFIGTAAGIGAILGALVAAWVVKKIGTIRSFWLALLSFGLILLLFGRMTLFAPALVLIFLAGFPTTAASVALNPLLLRTIPRDLLGRVNAVFTTCISVASMLSVSMIGVLASLISNMQVSVLGLRFGPYDTILSASGLLTMCVGCGVALALRNVQLSQAQSRDEEQATHEESSC